MKLNRLQCNDDDEMMRNHISEQIHSGGVARTEISSDRKSVTLRMKPYNRLRRRRGMPTYLEYYTYSVTLTEAELRMALASLEHAKG